MTPLKFTGPPAGPLPSVLTAEKRWAPWAAKWNKPRGKWDKIPRRADHPERGLSTANPARWFTYAQTVAAIKAAPDVLAGAGYCMTGAHGIVGVDMDNCVTDGVLAPWAAEVVQRMGSYSEFSPSGRGLRIFVKALAADDWTNHEAGVECYAGHAPRFLTLTGQRLPGAPAEVNDAPAGALAWLAEKYRKAKKETTEAGALPDLVDPATLPSAEQVLAWASDEAVVDLLQGLPVADRSGALRGVARALRFGDLDGPQILTWLTENPTTMEVAMGHRGQDTDRATDYLWRFHAAPAVAEDTTRGEILAMFEALAPLPAPVLTAGYVNFGDLDTNPPPPRRWVLEGWIPRGAVTALSGMGGTGKSLIAQQLATAVAHGLPFLSIATTRGPVLGLFAEDDADELRRRHIGIARHYAPTEPGAGLFIDARAGLDNTLAVFEKSGRIKPTEVFKAFKAEAERIRPVLVLVDNIAQTFAGSEIDRHQVTAFCNLLTAIAQAADCGVLLLGHVAKGDGSEYSGSTAWDAAVRARLFLSRGDDGVLTLQKSKSNYAARDQVQFVRNDQGAFVLHRPGEVAEGSFDALRWELLAAVQSLNAQRIATSNTPTARNYLLSAMGIPKAKRAPYATALRQLVIAGELLPAADLPWKKADRHRATGLAVAPGIAVAPLPPGVSLSVNTEVEDLL